MPVQITEGNYFGDIVKRREYSYFHCSITAYKPDTEINEHFHDNNYLSLLIKGTYFEKHKGNTDQINPGQIIFRPTGYMHANAFDDGGGACFNIEFKSDLQELLGMRVKLPGRVRMYHTGHLPSAYKLLSRFMNLTDEDMYDEFVVDCFSGLDEQVPLHGPFPWLNKVKSILDSEIDEHHTLHSLSNRVFVHPIYLARAFKQTVGSTIGEYQRRKKLQRSLDFLFNSDMPMNAIAFHCGFCDTSHFVNAFKLTYNISPARFRTAVKS